MARVWKLWTPEDIEFLRHNYARLGMEGCAKALFRSVNSVCIKATELKLSSNQRKVARNGGYYDPKFGTTYAEPLNRCEVPFVPPVIKSYPVPEPMLRLAEFDPVVAKAVRLRQKGYGTLGR